MLRLLLCQNIIGDLIMSNVVCKIYVIIALMLMASCSKEQSGASYFNETYAGTYRLVSATYAPDPVYFTDPIDFDGSGKKTKDIIEGLGLTSYELNQMTTVVFGISDHSASDVKCLTLYVPAQHIRELSTGQLVMDAPNTVICPVHFYYTIGENGDMCIYGKGDLTDTFSIYGDGIYKTNPQVLRFEKAELVSFENGEITIKINNMYFVDWTDGNYVSSDSFFTYKKD